MKKTNYLKINIPASEKYLSPARLAISGLANQAKFSVQEIQEIKQAFSQALQLAIDHAYVEDLPKKRVAIECRLQKDTLSLTVHNPGLRIDIKKKASS